MDPRAAPRKIAPPPSSFRSITGENDNAEDKKCMAGLKTLQLGADVATITQARDNIYILTKSVSEHPKRAMSVVEMMFQKKDGGDSVASNLLMKVAVVDASELLANPKLGLELKSILQDMLTWSQKLLNVVLSVVQKAFPDADAKAKLRKQGVNVDDVQQAIQASLQKCQPKRMVGTSPGPAQNKKPKSRRGICLNSIVTKKQAAAVAINKKPEEPKPPRQKISQNVAVAEPPPAAPPAAPPAPPAMAAQDDNHAYDDDSWESWQREMEGRAERDPRMPWMLMLVGLVDPMEMDPDFEKVSRDLGLDDYLQALKDGKENPEEALPPHFQNCQNVETPSKKKA